MLAAVKAKTMKVGSLKLRPSAALGLSMPTNSSAPTSINGNLITIVSAAPQITMTARILKGSRSQNAAAVTKVRKKKIAENVAKRVFPKGKIIGRVRRRVSVVIGSSGHIDWRVGIA